MCAEDDGRWDRSRAKEADKIDLQQFPDGQNWRSWRANTIHAVVSAAGRQDDLAQAWIMQVETAESEILDDPGIGWISLDRKLASALIRTAKGEIGRELIQYHTAALNNDLVVRGRVLLAIVFRYYSSGTTGQVMFDMNHLQTLTLQGNNLEAFHNTWNMVISELSHVPDQEILQFWYFNQLRNFRAYGRRYCTLQTCKIR